MHAYVGTARCHITVESTIRFVHEWLKKHVARTHKHATGNGQICDNAVSAVWAMLVDVSDGSYKGGHSERE
jgi:hypothetical protein